MDFDNFLDRITPILSNVNNTGRDNFMLLGHDINAGVGTRSTDIENKFEDVIGPHGINSRNQKGLSALNFLQSLNLKIANTFFIHPSYTTWTHNVHHTHHMLDIWTTNTLSRIHDCKVFDLNGILNSDHSAVIAKIHLNTIKHSGTDQIDAGVTDWKEIKENDERFREFNSKIREATNENTCYTDFHSAILEAGASTATKPKEVRRGWFEMSREILQPLVQRKNKLCTRLRRVPAAVKELFKETLNDLKKQVKEAVEEAKAKWSAVMATAINAMNDQPKEAWKKFRAVEDGVTGHHTKPRTMRMRKSDGTLANNDKDNMHIFSNHLNRVYNHQRAGDKDAAQLIAQRELYQPMGTDITWAEFSKAIVKLKNDKSPGENGVPPNAFKCLDETNKERIFKYICSFWEDTEDYKEWHVGIVKLLPNTGDLISNPNKWRGITLMDVCSKIFSTIMADRAQTLLDLHGIKNQFGGMRNVGCADGQFVLKSLLHLRHQHNLESYVMFIDLVKAYDTLNHEVLFDILEKYGAHPKYVDCVRRMYSVLIAKVKIGSETEEIHQTVGVRQGDNLSPVLFLFVISAFAESLEDEFVASGIERSACRKVSVDTLYEAQLISHEPRNFKRGDEFEVCDIYFVDDGSLVLTSRAAIEKAAPIVDAHFAKFYLEMHVGTFDEEGREIASKTECIYFAKPGFYDNSNHPSIELELPANTLSLTGKKRESPAARYARESTIYDNAPQTARIWIHGRGFIDFTKVFHCVPSSPLGLR